MGSAAHRCKRRLHDERSVCPPAKACVLLYVEQRQRPTFEAAKRKAVAFLAVRLGATRDITLECGPHAGCENRQVGQVVVDEQGQR